MMQDCRGIDVTSRSQVALLHLEEATASFLAHRRDLSPHIEAALAADPDLVVAHCLAGFSYLLLGRAELLPLARHGAGRARAALARRGGTARELALTEALGAWCHGAMERCVALLDATLNSDPCDALTIKLVHSIRFMLGDAAGMRRSLERVLPAWSSDAPGHGFMLGCHAFALEETGALDAAERIGREAIAIEPFDVWACHAVAHVYETRGETARGLAWVMLHEPRWGEVNNFARHMSWHRALFHLARNEADIALGLYDAQIRAKQTDDYRDIANGASLLLRLEARGVRGGRRWTELADIAERHIHDHALAFAQLHYLLCLIGDGRIEAAYRCFAAMDAEARCGHGTQARILSTVGVDVAKAMLGGPVPRTKAGVAARSAVARLGGSRAQRQIFEWFLDGFDAATLRDQRAAA